jgi:hypothetical protein
MTQFIRNTYLRIGIPGEDGLEINGLRIAFEVVKQDGQPLNTCKLTVYNANLTTSQATRREGTTLQLYAGYGDAAGLIFLGDITRSGYFKERPETRLELESGDGQAARTKSASLSLKGEQPVTGVLDKLAELAGLSLDTSAVDTSVSMPSTSGITLNGQVLTQVNRVARANRFDWTIEDGRIVLTPRGAATTLPALVVSPSTGMVGSPSPGEGGRVVVKMLLNPEVRLRRIIKLESSDYNGFYLVRRVRHAGDSGWATEYYTEVECTRI